MKKNKDILIQYIGLIMACMIMAVGLNMFLVPKTIAPGGLSGLSVVISKHDKYTAFTFLSENIR